MDNSFYAPSHFIYSGSTASASMTTLTSPKRKRHTQAATYQFSDSKTQKEAAFQDVTTSCFIVSKNMFFESVLPQLKPGADVGATIQQLKDQGLVENSRFTHFPVNPCQATGTENHVFKILENLVADIVGTFRSQDFPPTMKFICNPNGVPNSYDRNSLSRPDCCVMEVDADVIEWIRLAVAGELKLKNTYDTQDDVRTHILIRYLFDLTLSIYRTFENRSGVCTTV